MAHRVVVIDDEADLRHLLVLTLGFDDRLIVCGAAAAAEEVVALVERERPDLVVMDYWLGGPLTGVDVAVRLRLMPSPPVVVLFTAADDVLVDDHPGAVQAIVAKENLADLPELVVGLVAAAG